MTRDDVLTQFLANAGLSPSDFTFLAGDASNRKYYRSTPTATVACLLMDAPPAKGEDIRPFLTIAHHLISHGLAAPQIFASDTENGFILLEDFGDGLFFDLVTTDPTVEMEIYDSALAVLDHLHRAPVPPHITQYGPTEMADVAGLVCDWYCPDMDRKTIVDPMYAALDQLDWSTPVLVLRDYHAQNLVWRAEHSGLAQVGLLDFQDAQIGHRFYDAMSLLDDARRDVSKPLRDDLLLRLTKGDPKLDLECNVVSAQRNLRILGVFARLCIRDGKESYIDLIPRVWRNLQRNLATQGLDQLASACSNLPAPTDTYLNELRSKCAKKS